MPNRPWARRALWVARLAGAVILSLPFTEDTHSPPGSVSKLFTTAAVMILTR